MNENQVSVGMMGVYEFRNCQTEKDILEADDITLLLLERGRTARQAIEMIGELIEEYGYTVSSIDGAAGAVCMAVADPEEGFFLELVPGGKWVAKRVADDEVECRPTASARRRSISPIRRTSFALKTSVPMLLKTVFGRRESRSTSRRYTARARLQTTPTAARIGR